MVSIEYKNEKGRCIKNLLLKRNNLCIFLFGSILSTSAFADIIKVSFQANITRMYESECVNLVDFACDDWIHTDVNSSLFFADREIKDTDTAQGFYVYDTSAEYVLSDDGHQAVHLDGITDFDMTLGQIAYPNVLLPISSGSVSVVDNRPSGSNQIDMLFLSQWLSMDDWFSSVNIFLQDRNGNYVDGFELPEFGQPTDFTSMTFRNAFVYRPTGDQLQISGDVTNLRFENITQVNSPATALLLLIGLGLFFKRYTVRQNRR